MQSAGMSHPREMGVADVKAFLNSLYRRTGIPRSRIRSLACCTVYSP
jgi:hypothetical protein